MMRLAAGLAGITLAQAARVKTDARDVSLSKQNQTSTAVECAPQGVDEYSSKNKAACNCKGVDCSTDKYCYKTSFGASPTCQSTSARPDDWLNANGFEWCETNDATKLTKKCACDRTAITTLCDPTANAYCFSPFGSSSPQCQQIPKCPQDATGMKKITKACACDGSAPCDINSYCAYDDQAKTAKCNLAPTCSKSDTDKTEALDGCMCEKIGDQILACKNQYCFDVAGKPTCSANPRRQDCTCENGDGETKSNTDNDVGCLPEAMAKCTECKSGFTLTPPEGGANTVKTCKKNMCTCLNGKPAEGEDCPKMGAQNCAQDNCKEGFMSTPDRDPNNPHIGRACYPKQCRCENGLATAGAKCKEHNSLSCDSCGADYKLTSEGDKSVCKPKTGKNGGSDCRTNSDCQSNDCKGYAPGKASVAAAPDMTKSDAVAETLGKCGKVCKCPNGKPKSGADCLTDGAVSCMTETTTAAVAGTCTVKAAAVAGTCTTNGDNTACAKVTALSEETACMAENKDMVEANNKCVFTPAGKNTACAAVTENDLLTDTVCIKIDQCEWKAAADQSTSSGGCNPGFGPDGKCDKENICKCTDGADEAGLPMKGVMPSGGYCKTDEAQQSQCLKCTKSRYHFVEAGASAAAGDFGKCVQNTCVCNGRSDSKKKDTPVGAFSTGADCDKFEKSKDPTKGENGVAQMCSSCSDPDYVFNQNQKSCTDGCAETGGACGGSGTAANGVKPNLWQAKNGRCCGADRIPATNEATTCVANGMKDAEGNYQHIIYDVVEGKGRHLFGGALNSCMTSKEKELSDASYSKFAASQKVDGDKCDNNFDCKTGKCVDGKCGTAVGSDASGAGTCVVTPGLVCDVKKRTNGEPGNNPNCASATSETCTTAPITNAAGADYDACEMKQPVNEGCNIPKDQEACDKASTEGAACKFTPTV